MIKYSWAKFKGRPVHISEVTPEMRKEDKFFNTLTGKRMTAYLNGKFQKHFHHLEHVESHSYESYLHKTSKEVFADTYLDCLKNNKPFFLHYWETKECRQHYKTTGIICNLGDNLEAFDLTKVFKQVKVEKGHDGLQPDINLIADIKGEAQKQEVIYIEIFVTHKSDEKKIIAGKRIVEVKINNESDILKLRSCNLSVDDKNTIFYNFKKQKKVINFCTSREKGCRTFCKTFILYKNGGYEFMSDSLENILSHVATEKDRILKIDYKANATSSEEKDNYVQRLVNSNTKIKDCRYCKYAADKIKKNKKLGLFCKFLKKDVQFDTAFDCNYYRKK